jgi:hypothetical protein
VTSCVAERRDECEEAVPRAKREEVFRAEREYKSLLSGARIKHERSEKELFSSTARIKSHSSEASVRCKEEKTTKGS